MVNWCWIGRSLRRDQSRVHQMEWPWGNSSSDAVCNRPAGYCSYGGHFRLAQQYARRQGIDTRIDLPDPGRHVFMLFDHVPFVGRSRSSQLLSFADHARIQLLHDLRRSAHQNESDRPDLGRQQKTHPHAQIQVAFSNSPGFPISFLFKYTLLYFCAVYVYLYSIYVLYFYLLLIHAVNWTHFKCTK